MSRHFDQCPQCGGPTFTITMSQEDGNESYVSCRNCTWTAKRRTYSPVAEMVVVFVLAAVVFAVALFKFL